MDISQATEKIHALRSNIASVLLGKPQVVEKLLIGLLAGGHVLIEDVPGVGKTVVARALARSIDCEFVRIQFTPDLLPSDIIGVSVLNRKTNQFEFRRGPIFANVVLADEINRTTPRTQSALLEAMSVAEVSVDGRTYPLPSPFMVIATQNPFEFEGTYFLPENQLDRFLLRIGIGYPSRQVEREILQYQPGERRLARLEPVMASEQVRQLQALTDAVRFDEVLMEYVLALVEATRQHPQLHVGVSPRGSLALMRAARAAAVLAGRDYVVPDDIKQLAVETFAHRVVSKGFLTDGQSDSAVRIIREIVKSVPCPD